MDDGASIAQVPVVSRPPAGSHALGDNLFLIITGIGAGLLNLILALIVVILWVASGASVRAFGWEFLWTSSWIPPTAATQQLYGALPFVYGTLVTSALALLIGVPLSLGIAVFLTELSPRWIREPLGFVVELLAAVPSVVYGLWGLFVLVPFMRSTLEPAIQSVLGWTPAFSGHAGGADMFTAGVILAIMIIPTVSAVSRDSFKAVPSAQREAALSLGATQWETTRISVLSYARAGIFGAVVLGLGRAIGETMAVTMTIGNANTISASLFSPANTIASWIANNFTESGYLQRSALLELGLILLGISLLVNLGARMIFRRFGGPKEAVI